MSLPATSNLSLLASGSLLVLLAFGCSKSTAQESQQPAAAPKEDAAEARAPLEEEEPDARAERRAPGTTTGEDAADFEASEGESEAPLDDSAPSEPEGAAPSTGPEDPKALVLTLRESRSLLDDALGTTSLSCDGALPHRDAICSIARRICDLDADDFADGAHACKRAKESCQSAKRRYRQKCE